MPLPGAASVASAKAGGETLVVAGSYAVCGRSWDCATSAVVSDRAGRVGSEPIGELAVPRYWCRKWSWNSIVP